MSDSKPSNLTKYISAWNGRLRAVFLEFIVLWQGAYSPNPTYSYSIAQTMEQEWGPNTVPLTTIYSSIKRLEAKGLITVTSEIVNGRVQKLISTKPEGFDVLKMLRTSIEEQFNWFQKFEKERTL